jgi:hypothetical protein
MPTKSIFPEFYPSFISSALEGRYYRQKIYLLKFRNVFCEM